jgi:DNA-binding CsgD family transcriptional regulator
MDDVAIVPSVKKKALPTRTQRIFGAVNRWIDGAERLMPRVPKTWFAALHGRLTKIESRAGALIRTRKAITFRRLSFGLVMLRWLALLQLVLAEILIRPVMQPYAPWPFVFIVYVFSLSILAKPIHLHMEKGNWQLPVAVDAAWLLLLVSHTGGLTSPLFWLLCVPPVSAGLYTRRFRRRTTFKVAGLVVLGYLAVALVPVSPVSGLAVFVGLTRSGLILLASGVGAVVSVLGHSHGRLYDLRKKVAPASKLAEPVEAVMEAVHQGVEDLRTDRRVLLQLVPHPCRHRVRNALGLSKEDWPANRSLPARALTQEEIDRSLTQLTPRQLDVVILRAQGEQVEDVGGVLGLKKSGVEQHLKNVKQRIGLRDATDLTLFAVLTQAIDRDITQ